MLYIKQEVRIKLELAIDAFTKNVETAGDFARILTTYVKKKKIIEPSYNNYKNFMAELTECGFEVLRRFKIKKEKPIKWSAKISLSRIALKNIIEVLEETDIQMNGDLNYILFAFYRRNAERLKINAKTFHKRMEWIVKKIRKQVLAKYEDEKMKVNGDVK